jgi:hypothetical protein
VPGGVPPFRDPRLGLFASEDGVDALVPSSGLAVAADEVSGPGRRCPGATGDELIGLARAWAAIESWAASGKLGVIAEMIRRDDGPRKPGGWHGDLPDQWSPSLRHELALALACSVQSAETTIWLAWEHQARLPGIGTLLASGILTPGKARAVVETFKYLTDADAARAEALILDQLAGKTYPQVLRLAEQAALTVDPGLAERRRLQAQKSARVTFFRELSGTAGLSGRDLPPDEALAAMAGVNERAQVYEDSGAFGATPMDALRAYAYLDLLKGTPTEDRIASAVALDEAAEIAEALAWANARAAQAGTQAGNRYGPDAGRREGAHTGAAAQTGSQVGNPSGPGAGNSEGAGTPSPEVPGCRRDDGDDEPDDPVDGSAGGPDGSGPGGSGPRGPRSGGPASGSGTAPAGRALQARPPDLVVPLLTLLGLAERPGEIQGFGLLDPALARDLAAAAAASPRTQVCVTVTSPEGYAIGHGCARPERSLRQSPAETSPGAILTGLPARLNLTIPASALASCDSAVGLTNSAVPWSFAPHGRPGSPGSTGPPDGFGSWALALPDGRRLTVRLDAVPVLACDHRYETRAYQPGAKLRHLVQVRDGTCTFPSCNRHAKESDFEHAQPYHRGGKTCACNAGARSRACHRVKQTAGWSVTQPRPGWHRWTTPSGRSYVQGPKRYPA